MLNLSSAYARSKILSAKSGSLAGYEIHISSGFAPMPSGLIDQFN